MSDTIRLPENVQLFNQLNFDATEQSIPHNETLFVIPDSSRPSGRADLTRPETGGCGRFLDDFRRFHVGIELFSRISPWYLILL